jgi:hypothetical protein
MLAEFREQIKRMKDENYKEFVVAIILEEYEWEGVDLIAAEEIYEIFTEFDDLVKITELVDAHEIWFIEKLASKEDFLATNKYQA